MGFPMGFLWVFRSNGRSPDGQKTANQDCMGTARAALERNWIVLYRTWAELAGRCGKAGMVAENRKIIGKSIGKLENHGKTITNGKTYRKIGKSWENHGNMLVECWLNCEKMME